MSEYSLLVESGKHDPAYHLIVDNNIEPVAQAILQQRIADGCYYVEKHEKQEAQTALDNNKAWKFLLSRADYEYEEISHERFQK